MHPIYTFLKLNILLMYYIVARWLELNPVLHIDAQSRILLPYDIDAHNRILLQHDIDAQSRILLPYDIDAHNRILLQYDIDAHNRINTECVDFLS